MKPTKICSKCNQEKEIEAFNNGKQYHDGKTPSCKLCIKKAKQIYYLHNKDNIKVSIKSYSDANKIQINKNKQEYYIKNKSEIIKKQKIYSNENKDKIHDLRIQWYIDNTKKAKEQSKQWLTNNKAKAKIIKQRYIKKKKELNPLFKLTENLRSVIANSFRREGYKKLSRTEQILGCSYYEFKQHLEALFLPWMNWQNRGLYNGTENYGWDIDHIIPLASATCEADIIRLNHYTNLQPLCSYQNRVIKRDN